MVFLLQLLLAAALGYLGFRYGQYIGMVRGALLMFPVIP